MSVRVGTGRSANTLATTATTEAIKAATAKLEGAPPACAIVFASSRYQLSAVLNAAHAALPSGTPLLGSTTAGEITEAGISHDGIAAVVIADPDMRVVKAFAERISSGPERAAKTLIEGVGGDPKHKPNLSLLVIDALTGAGEAVVDELRQQLGVGHQIVGGAAGDDGKLVRTHVGLDQQVATDAAAALHIHCASPWAVGVDHGFSAATSLMRVTRAEGTTLRELDGKPVLDVYKDYARKCGQTWDNRKASSFLVNNELGIYVLDKFRKARAPLAVNVDGSFACAAPIPENATVAILKSDPAALLAAAKTAAQEAKSRLRGKEAAGILVFDCVCRGTILGDAFPRELAAIKDVFPNVPLAGFVTYGEIARYSGQFDGWHNASVVVVAIPA